MPSCDAIVVGAGHNGLVCAAYLARSGLNVLVLESADEVGGAARTVEFAPGYKVSHVAHILNQLQTAVVRELQLKKYGLSYAASDLPTTALDLEARHLTFRGGAAERIDGDLADTERAAWSELRGRLVKYSGVLKPYLAKTPPRLRSGRMQDSTDLAALGFAVRRMGRKHMQEFLRMILMNVADVLEEDLSDDRLMGALAFDSVLGTGLGPRSPNSLMCLYYRLAGDADGMPGGLALPRGGMGSVAETFRNAAIAQGAQVRTGSPVRRILVDNDRACGVRLDNGEEIHASIVVSAANPKTTFLDLLGPQYLDTGFVRKVSSIRMNGRAAKLHLALDGLPSFDGVPESDYGGRFVVSPSIDHVERAFNPSKYGEYAPEPVMEFVLPSVSDPSLAPEGKHVLSAVVQYAPAGLKAGWDNARDGFYDAIMAVLEQYSPGLRDQVTSHELLTPDDMEAQYSMPGGHWHHGELGIDQMFMLRPAPGAAQYASPVPGLYLCGAGSHPGGGIMGAAGRNAASVIVKREA